jgi:beta-lactamase regulating signal transducer with metallopeptidase domain
VGAGLLRRIRRPAVEAGAGEGDRGIGLCGLSLPWRVLRVHRDVSQVAKKPLSGALLAPAPRIDDLPVRMPEPIERDPILPTSAANRSSRGVAKTVQVVSASSPGEPLVAVALAAIEQRAPWEVTVWRVVTAIYVAGCRLFLMRIAAGLARLRRLIGQSTPVDRSNWLLEIERWQRELKFNRPVRLVWSETVSTPMTFTRGCAFIVIPSELLDTATAEQRGAAILHELAHVQRADFAWQLLLRIVEAI